MDIGREYKEAVKSCSQ